MENDFMLPVEYAGAILQLPSRIVQSGYVVQLEVEIEGTTVTFERDEDSSWRAVMGFDDMITGKKVNKELLKKVAEVIGELTR